VGVAGVRRNTLGMAKLKDELKRQEEAGSKEEQGAGMSDPVIPRSAEESSE